MGQQQSPPQNKALGSDLVPNVGLPLAKGTHASGSKEGPEVDENGISVTGFQHGKANARTIHEKGKEGETTEDELLRSKKKTLDDKDAPTSERSA